MTPEPPAYDTGNRLLAAVPCEQICALVTGPDGVRMAYTIRTPDTTLTVFLTKADAARWRDVLTEMTGRMSGQGLIVAPDGQIPQAGG